MSRAPTIAVAVLSAALLTACAQEKPELRPTRTAGEGAWYESTKAERHEYCEAYRAHDPQHPSASRRTRRKRPGTSSPTTSTTC